MKKLCYFVTILLVIAINFTSCKKDPEPESQYYIKGIFKGESVNYSMDTAYYFTNEHLLSLIAYDDSKTQPHYFSLSLSGHPTKKPFYIDSISLPYTISKARNDVEGIFEFIRDTSLLNSSADSANYFGLFGISESYPANFTLVIEKISNDVIEGKFFGEVRTSFDPVKSMPVTDGKFRAKFDRVTFKPWWY